MFSELSKKDVLNIGHCFCLEYPGNESYVGIQPEVSHSMYQVYRMFHIYWQDPESLHR